MKSKYKKQFKEIKIEVKQHDLTNPGKCPICGSDLIPRSHHITTRFPSPPLEQFACTNTNCNYNKYLKMDGSGLSVITKTVP